MRTMLIERTDGSVGAWLGLEDDDEATRLAGALIALPIVRRVACVDSDRQEVRELVALITAGESWWPPVLFDDLFGEVTP